MIILLSCLFLGVFVGFLAGLFGIGGGLIIVPSLAFLLPMAGVPPEYVMSTALGTSFSTIIITAFSSAQRHHKLGNVDVQTSKTFIPALMVSVFLGGLIVSRLDAQLMSKIFAVMVLYLAGRMLFNLKKAPKNKPLTVKSTLIGGGIIGTLSSMAGIAGGAFIVPFLSDRGLEMKRAIGTSSFCGAFLGLSGTISFIASGWGLTGMPNWSLGYVYLPALIGITATSN